MWLFWVEDIKLDFEFGSRLVSCPHSCIRNLLVRAEEDYEQPQSGWLVPQTGFETGSSRKNSELSHGTDTNPAPLLSYYLNRRATRCSYVGSFIYALNISRCWCCHSLRCWGNAKTIMILSLAKLSQGVQTPSRLWFLWQFLLASFKTATRRVGVCLLCLRSATSYCLGWCRL
jgi:hypothetical protein